MRYVLLGGRGILGSGFSGVFARRDVQPARLSPPWGAPQAVGRHLEAHLPPLLDHEQATTVVWAAGVGHIGADAASLATETAGIEALCSVLRQLPTASVERVSVLFASSAGALFGGHGSSEVGDGDEPRPISAYGRHKLQQEDMLHRLWQDTGCRVVLCRISNLYGLSQGRLTARGLISTALRSTRLRQPMTVYVSPDTRRDYVFNADAAAVSLGYLETAERGFSAQLVRDGTTRTVSEILSVVGSVCGRRVPANYAERPETRLQPRVLRFTPPPRGSGQVRRTPLEAAVRTMLQAPMSS